MSDTSPTVKKLQRQIESKMTQEQFLLDALEMSTFARELAKSKVRRDHPDWDERQVAREVLRLEFLPEKLPSGF